MEQVGLGNCWMRLFLPPWLGLSSSWPSVWHLPASPAGGLLSASEPWGCSGVHGPQGQPRVLRGPSALQEGVGSSSGPRSCLFMPNSMLCLPPTPELGVRRMFWGCGAFGGPACPGPSCWHPCLSQGQLPPPKYVCTLPRQPWVLLHSEEMFHLCHLHPATTGK